MSDRREEENSEQLIVEKIDEEDITSDMLDGDVEIVEEEDEASDEKDLTGEKRKIVRKKRTLVKDPGIRRIKYITKKLSKDKLDEYLESQNDGKKRKIIIKKVQKRDSEVNHVETSLESVEIIEETPAEIKEEKQGEQEKNYIDLASDYALPTSEAGDIKKEDLVPTDWKEKKISSYKKKPEGPPLLKTYDEGKVLQDRYEILEKIYEDINGVLYKVRDLKEEDGKKKIKSIKEIQYIPGEGVSQDVTRDTLKRLERMTSFLSDVEHPNLAKIYDYFSIMENKNVRFFMVMEYIDGNTLEEMLKVYVKEEKSIPVKTIFGIMEKICDALYYLHNKKPFPIGFGDLKPSNVMMALDGSIKFINYGIGTFFDTEEDGSISSRGTIGYAAPEQRGVDFTNTRADIFSLGVTVYYMLTGVDPEENPYDFKPLRKHKRFVSEKVQRFIDRCLAIHPEDRPDIDAVKKLITKMDLHELDLSSALKKKEVEIKKQEEEQKEEELPPPSAISQEKVEEIITDFKVKNPFIASKYGIVSVIFFLALLAYSINAAVIFVKNMPRKGNFLYMTSGSKNTITEFNLKNNRFRDFLTLPKDAGSLVYSKTRRVLYTVSSSASTLYEIDMDRGKILRTRKTGKDPGRILLSADENILYIINRGEHNMYFINTQTFKETRSLCELGSGPSYASMSQKGDRIFILNENEESVSVFDTEYNIIIRRVVFPGNKPKGIAGDNNRFYVCLSAADKLAVVDIKTGKILDKISVNPEPAIVLSAPGENKKIYVISSKGGSIEVFKTDNFSPDREKKYLGFNARDAIFTNDGKICIAGENDYIKTSSLGIYDMSSGNLTVIKSNSLLNFLALSNL